MRCVTRPWAPFAISSIVGIGSGPQGAEHGVCRRYADGRACTDLTLPRNIRAVSDPQYVLVITVHLLKSTIQSRVLSNQLSAMHEKAKPSRVNEGAQESATYGPI